MISKSKVPMKKFLLFFSLLCCLSAEVMAQPATYAMPFSIGRNNCGSTAGATTLYRFPNSGSRAYNYDSTFFFDYVSPNLSRNTLRAAYFPRLRVGNSTYTSTAPSSFTARDRFNTSAASVSFNPKDGKLYYLWTDYSNDVSATLKTYVWRWNPDTTFSTASFNSPGVGLLLDTLCSFVFDIGGITFDNQGNAWQLEFSNAPAPYKSRMRKIDFVTKVIDPIPDTLDLVGAIGGIGDTIYNVASGDITLMPNGQMYYVFDNKMYTPDYGSYGNATHHISSTFIDTIRKPTGATNLVGLAYGNGDLISSFSPGCLYRRIDPITGDTNYVNYTYLASKGVQSSDMSQISSGLGLAKRLVSIASAGPVGSYNVVYDIVVKNYGTTPLTNLQVYDSLRNINGVGNVSNVSTTMLTIPPPPGIALNAGFNGTTDSRLLQFSGQNLPNYPVDSNSFTIRVNCRIGGVLSGVVYNNSAVGYATGYKGVALRDSSTNGSVPDLNQNDKPDDASEGIPTPFVIAIDPLNSACGTLSSILYTENFGTGAIGGSGLLATMPTSPNSTSSTYTGTTIAPIAKNNFAIVTNANNANTTDFLSFTDHTGGGNGRMLLVNGDAPPRIIFRDTLPTACAGRQYSFSFWAAFPYSASYQTTCGAFGGFRFPKFKVQFRDQTTGLVTVADTTTNITLNSWTQFGYRWTMPASATGLIIELVNDAPGGCGNDFVIDDIVYGTCDPQPIVTASNSPVCLGDSVRFTSNLSDPSAIPGTKDYQWQVASAPGGPWSNIIGATSSSYLIYPAAAADTGKYYRVIVAPQGSIAVAMCQSISPGILLSGRKPSTAPTSVTAPSSTFCGTTSVTLTANGGVLGTGANYQWGTGSVVGTNPIAGATSTTYTVSVSTTTTYWVRIENTSSPCQAVTGGQTLTITINNPSVAPTSITGPNICNGSSTTLTAVGGTLGTNANYQWGTGGTPGTNPIAGATSSTYTVSPTVTTTYWVKIKNTSSPCTDSTAGVTKTITVNPIPDVVQPSGQILCNGASTGAVNFSGSVVGTVYSWTNSNTTIGLGASGSGNILSFTATNSGTTPISGTITVTPSYTNAGVTCTGTPQTFTITVNPTPDVVQPSNQALCNGASTGAVNFSGAVAGTTYSWTNSNTTIGLGASGSGNIPSFTATNAGTTAISGTITVTPSASGCGGTPKTFTITVNPTPTVTQPSNQALCNSAASSAVNFSGAVAGTTYSWTNSNTAIGLGASGSGNIPTFTATNAGTTAISGTITVTPSASGCGGTPKTFTITVNPTPTVTAPSNQSLCNGASTGAVNFSGAVAGTTYSWTNSNTTIGLGASGSGNIPSFTATNSGTTAVTSTITVTPSASGCGGTPQTFTITVNPTPTVTAPSNQSLCNGSSTGAVNFSGAVAGTTYSWTNSNTAIGLGASGSGNIGSFTATNAGTTPISGTITVTPSASGCGGTPQTFTIIVNPTPTVTQPSNQSLCNGSSTGAVNFSGAVAGTTYSWTNSNTTIGLGASGSGNIPSFTATNAGTTAVTSTITVTPSASGCGGTPQTFTITINPTPTVTQPSNQALCNGASTGAVNFSGAVAGTTYSWTNSNTTIGLGASGSGNIPSFTATNAGTTAVTSTITVTPSASGCGGTAKTFTITVNPTPDVTQPANVALCNGSSSSAINFSSAVAGTTYSWTNSNTAIGLAASGSGNIPSFTATNAGTTPITATITVTPSAAGCGGTPKTFTITVNKASVAPSSITGPDICNGSSTTLTANGGTLGTSANYQWGTGAIVGTSPIVGATSSTLTVSPSSTTTYWVRIENTAGPCTPTTSGVTKVITVSQPSVPATSAGRNKNNICPGISAKIYRTGGTLGAGASWKWYTGSPGGTLIGSGDTLTVTPAVTTTYYVRAEGLCNTTSAEAVTIFISCDIDKDKDGIPDFIESNIAAAVANGYNTGYAGYVDYNNDFINDNFEADGDSDNDGIPNYLDTTFPGRVDSNSDGIDDRFDTDLDGVINMLDLDSDNDGIPDVVEAYGVDANGDGKIDNFTDTDGDGLSQNVDANNTGANNSSIGLGVPNLDGDAVPNFLDLDSDNDGIPDIVEAGAPDTNNNGMVDGFVDANGDGLHDGYINGTALLLTGTDGNNDGKADTWPNKNLDRDLRPNAYDLDSDGDGITDVIEAGLPDANLNGLADGVIGANGWSTTVSAMPALNLRNTDGVGNYDYLDIDSDDDGIPDNIEGISTAAYAIPTLTDADGDGLMNPYDNQPAVFGGTGITPYDHDADGTPDYRDMDSDADGVSDRVEGNDYNLNGLQDDNVTPTGLDTDGDGLDNRYDSLNSVTNIKGTSYRMGNGGTFTGDATPGSRTTVQKTLPAQTDRDWRFVGYVLPVQFVKLSGQLQSNNKVPLSWTIIAATPVDHFEVERSIDNRNFIKTGTVTQVVNLNVQQTFNFTDDVSSVTKDVIYYRIKVVGKSGEIQYSNILVIRKQQTKPSLTIMPNPANDYVSIGLYAEKASDIIIRMIDESGKVVLLKNEKVSRGSNTLQLTGLTKYSAGTYMLQVFINDDVITQKLILMH
jgi:hypothetical protein